MEINKFIKSYKSVNIVVLLNRFKSCILKSNIAISPCIAIPLLAARIVDIYGFDITLCIAIFCLFSNPPAAFYHTQ